MSIQLSDKKIIWLIVLIMLWGFGIRMVDLTDPPLGFHPTRQLRGALITRGIYYSLESSAEDELTDAAISMSESFQEFEPPILETLVAYGYLILGGENLWIARILNSIFWVIGGWGIYMFSSRIASKEAGLLALVYFLFLPFSVEASRSFQPDPFMTMWIVLAILSAYIWSEKRTWKWVFITGIVSGIAVMVKVVAAYMIGGMMVGLVLSSFGLKKSLKNGQVWAMALIMVLPAAIYYLFGIGQSSSSYLQSWIIDLMPLLGESVTYVGWYKRIRGLIRLEAFVGGFVGMWLAKDKVLGLILGLWVGYIIYGLSLPHQIATHSYYHIQFVPVIAISLVPLFQLILDYLNKLDFNFRYVFVVGLVGMIGLLSWKSIGDVLEKDYRHDPSYWETLGVILPGDDQTIGLVQHYGHSLMYYGWEDMSLWPILGEQRLTEIRGGGVEGDFEEIFLALIEDNDYFIVTNFVELDNQPELKNYLYDHYSIFEEGGGWVIFDLTGN